MTAAKKLARHNRPWTKHDLKRMRAKARAGMSARLAAADLGRTTGSVKYKAMVEGVSFHYINQPRGVQKKAARSRRRNRRITAKNTAWIMRNHARLSA